MDYLLNIISFVAGGGISTILSIRYARKTTKLDYADRAVNFLDKQNENLIQRIDELEKKVDNLILMQCTSLECPLRKNPQL